jgi:ribulose-phosphate 3-epimerase
MNAVRIAPSLLSADFARLGEEVSAVVSAGADLIHLDVMDNHYVPMLTVGPQVCQAIKPYCETATATVPIDVHLMVKPVDGLIAMFAQAGAGIISFHPEASEHIDRSLQLIHALGVKAGLVLNPATPLHWLDHVIDRLDLILLMSVNPGFGGQSFIESTLPKIEAVRRRIDASGRDIWLEVDGGVKPDNAERIGSAGADTLVAGSAIFNGGRYQQVIHAIRLQASAGRHARVTLQ